jgi:SAM-dependent methyltransferase
MQTGGGIMPVIIQEQDGLSDAKTAEYWDANADVWADQVRRGWDAYREVFNNPAFLRFMGDLSGQRVLDAGCGEGRNTRLLALRGARLTGIDISKNMIRLARQKERAEPLGIRYETGSFADLSRFDRGAFDTVVSFMALMDGAHYDQAAAQIYRVLKPGGRLIFSITHPCFVTKGNGWLEDENGEPAKLTVADYFIQKPWLEKWCFSKSPAPDMGRPFQVPRFPRTLSDYLNPLMENGFRLVRLEEPRPGESLCKEYPWLARWRKHAAIFMYVWAEKPV